MCGYSYARYIVPAAAAYKKFHKKKLKVRKNTKVFKCLNITYYK